MRGVEAGVVREVGCGVGVGGREHMANMVNVGLSPQSLDAPTVLRHQFHDLGCVVHGDDFKFVGAPNGLTWVAGHMGPWYEVKAWGILGPEKGD